MAEARSLFDRSQLKADDNIHGRFNLVSSLEAPTTRRNVACSSGNDGAIYMLSSNLACHSAGLSVTCSLKDLELDSPAGHLATSETYLLAQVSFSLRKYRFELLDCKHENHKIPKNITPGVGEDTEHENITGADSWLFLLSFPYKNAADSVRLVSLCFERVCFACGEVIRSEAAVAKTRTAARSNSCMTEQYSSVEASRKKCFHERLP